MDIEHDMNTFLEEELLTNKWVQARVVRLRRQGGDRNDEVVGGEQGSRPNGGF
jgi:hypothetical protein